VAEPGGERAKLSGTAAAFLTVPVIEWLPSSRRLFLNRPLHQKLPEQRIDGPSLFVRLIIVTNMLHELVRENLMDGATVIEVKRRFAMQPGKEFCIPTTNDCHEQRA
jgi:hypothetical protein